MSKYYTPDIEEFYVNFEYEKAQTIDNNYNLSNWKKVNDFSNDYEYEDSPLYGLIKDLDKGFIRVKYLDDSDIEELGFKLFNEYEFIKTFKSINTNAGIILYEGGRIVISSEIYDSTNCIFEGKIKNKNELKKLLKQLEIN